jgi:hypothetical protein
LKCRDNTASYSVIRIGKIFDELSLADSGRDDTTIITEKETYLKKKFVKICAAVDGGVVVLPPMARKTAESKVVIFVILA